MHRLFFFYMACVSFCSDNTSTRAGTAASRGLKPEDNKGVRAFRQTRFDVNVLRLGLRAEHLHTSDRQRDHSNADICLNLYNQMYLHVYALYLCAPCR